MPLVPPSRLLIALRCQRSQMSRPLLPMTCCHSFSGTYQTHTIFRDYFGLQNRRLSIVWVRHPILHQRPIFDDTYVPFDGALTSGNFHMRASWPTRSSNFLLTLHCMSLCIGRGPHPLSISLWWLHMSYLTLNGFNLPSLMIFCAI